MTDMQPGARARPMTTHGFLGEGGRAFGTYHTPSAPARNLGYVVCPPLGYEGVHCYRSLRLLAESLAAGGYSVLRVEYDGTGEALGSDEDPGRVTAWKRSVAEAIDVLAGVEHVDSVGLIGLRMGGTLAALVAAETPVAELVLWEPCVSGGMYVRELEIVASAAGAAAPDDVPGIQAGGFLYSPETISDLKSIQLDEVTPAGSPDVLLLWRDDRRAQAGLADHLAGTGSSVVTEQVPGHKEMMAGSNPVDSEAPMTILERIRDWAARKERPEVEPGAAPPLTREAVTSPTRRRLVRFGEGDRLFAVLTEPEDARTTSGSAVLLLTGGVVPRTAVNRMWLAFADRLARQGHTVLRMDVSGVGESYPAPGEDDNQTFPPSLLADVAAGLDLVGLDRAWLIGLCSGAAAAFQTSLSDPRIAGTVLINPPVFYWEEGVASDSLEVKQFHEASYYRSSMFEWAKWKKLLSGKADVGHILKVVLTRVRTMISSRLAKVSIPGLHEAEGLGPDLGRILDREIGVTLVFSPGDASHVAFTSLVGGDLPRLQRRGLDVRMFEGADHTFSRMGIRGELIEWVAAKISGAGEER